MDLALHRGGRCHVEAGKDQTQTVVAKLEAHSYLKISRYAVVLKCPLLGIKGPNKTMKNYVRPKVGIWRGVSTYIVYVCCTSMLQ